MSYFLRITVWNDHLNRIIFQTLCFVNRNCISKLKGNHRTHPGILLFLPGGTTFIGIYCKSYTGGIFKSIYNGGFSLSIDEKYNIQVIVNEFEGVNEDVETSTAQSISVIFAFIAGVIKMARRSQNPENEMLVSEPYPLVMDAPLSAFDKARIRTVCDALPNVAEQVIIFIKDTDGELAETYMGDKVGSRFEFDKKNEFETNLVTR